MLFCCGVLHATSGAVVHLFCEQLPVNARARLISAQHCTDGAARTARVTSDWDRRPLLKTQLEYAALDAEGLVRVWERLPTTLQSALISTSNRTAIGIQPVPEASLLPSSQRL